VPSANVELVRGLYEAWLAGDREAAIAGVDPAIEWIEPADSPDPETHYGYEGVERSMAHWTEGFDEYGFDILSVRDLGGGRVLGCLLQRARAGGSTVPVEDMLFHIWTIRNGRAVRAEMFRTEQEALNAAGAV
jgi:ketosteroid isomerase-like protein